MPKFITVLDGLEEFYENGYGKLKTAADQGVRNVKRFVDDVGRNMADVQGRQAEAERQAAQAISRPAAARPASQPRPAAPRPTQRPAPTAQSVGLRGPIVPQPVFHIDPRDQELDRRWRAAGGQPVLQWPMQDHLAINQRNPAVEQGSGEFGLVRRDQRGRRRHDGLDITADPRTPIYASADGRVTRSQFQSPDQRVGYGSYVRIDHGDGVESRSAHLSGRTVEAGDRVRRGQLIGYTGTSGNLPDGGQPHNHFEVIYRGQPVDPRLFIGPSGYPAIYSPRDYNRLWGDG